MSVINKKPLINTILDGLDSSELSDLKACINGQGPAPIFRSLKPISNAHLTTDDYGVKPIKLELAIPLGGMNVYEGYLIYNASMCYVISYASEADQLLTILQVDVNNNKAKIVNGSLSILGLRSELDDATEAEAGEVTQGDLEEALGNVPVIHVSENDVSELTSEEVDKIHRGDILNTRGSDYGYICTVRGVEIILVSVLEDYAIDIVKYEEDGDGWVYETQQSFAIGGTKLYRHIVDYENDNSEFTFIDNNANPITASTTWHAIFNRLIGCVRLLTWVHDGGAGTELRSVSAFVDGQYGTIYGVDSLGTLRGGADDGEQFALNLPIPDFTSDTVTEL